MKIQGVQISAFIMVSIFSFTCKLKILIDAYGNIARLPCNEETAKIHNLTQEFNINYATDITTLRLGKRTQQQQQAV